MTPTQGLIAGLFVAFACGVYVGRDQRDPPAALPANFDAVSAVVEAKAAKQEAAVMQTVVMKALERCGTQTEQAH